MLGRDQGAFVVLGAQRMEPGCLERSPSNDDGKLRRQVGHVLIGEPAGQHDDSVDAPGAQRPHAGLLLISVPVPLETTKPYPAATSTSSMPPTIMA